MNTILDRLIRLTQLTELNIDLPDFNFDTLTRLLHLADNIRTLKLHSIDLKESDMFSTPPSYSFSRVSNKNKITSLIIYRNCSPKHCQLLVNLCPRVHYMMLGVSNHFESTAEFLLMKSNGEPSCLSSICFIDVTTKYLKILKSKIDSQKLLSDYSIKLIHNKLYLWW